MTSKTTINQFRWLAAIFMLVAAMVMPAVVWAGESTVTFTAKEGTAGFSNESFDKLFDGKYTSPDGTKWCLTFPTDGAYIIFSASEAIQVTGYSIVTGNDNASETGRNPKSWAIYGCNNASAGRSSESWVLIDEVTNDTKLQNVNYQQFDYTSLSNPPSEKYQYFKMEITATKGASVLQMSELILTYSTCNHNWVKTADVVPPTCTEDGYDVYKCSLCQLTKNVANDNRALGHQWVSGDVVAPTCTTDGYTLQTCSSCQAKQTINIVEAIGHQWGTDNICDICKAENSTSSKPIGDGSAEDPYQIGTVEELYWFAGLVNGDASVCTGDVTQKTDACAVLKADITVNQGDNIGDVANCNGKKAEGWKDWTPIAGGSSGMSFTGIFDGDGKTISGLYYNETNYQSEYGNFVFAGLFGKNEGTIKNVRVEDSYFGLNISNYVIWLGGLSGYNYGTIENCNYAGTVSVSGTNEDVFVGGICGSNEGTAIIKRCNNTGIVSSRVNSTSKVGGVSGVNMSSGIIESCSNTGEVSGTDNVGGVCGQNKAENNTFSKPTIKDSYNAGKVSGTNKVGGVCGYNTATGDDGIVEITNCYNTGEVTGTGSGVGGVSGYNECSEGGATSTIANCYNSGKVNDNYVSGVIGGNYGTAPIVVTNCYYLSETSTDDGGKTEGQFKRGEVCYLLNNGKTDGSQAWYQTLSDSGEGYPNLNKDAENRTVYAGYRHSEVTPYCSNSQSNIPSYYVHQHAYNSDASDEANGNHDMSYEQEAQNPYTWTDIDNYSNATAKCNFICSVCNSKVAKDMTVTHNEEKTNEPAKCIEKGHNYYVASLTFNGTPYTEYYTQEVPALGHDYSGTASINTTKHIYEKYCKRCSVFLEYCATSDGMVEAKYEDGVYKVPIFCLNDGLEYDSKAQYTVESLEYKRMYYDDKWAAVYVPFAIDCSQLPNFMEMAVINNFHEYEQENGSYNVVLEVKRKTSGTIPALTPCVIRLKEAPMDGVETVTMRFSNAVFSPAADKYIDCSSVTRYYKFSGSLAKIEGLLLDGRDFVLNAGKLYKANGQTVLLPQRWYLSAEDRAGSSTSLAPMLQSISINVVGDSDGDVTGIDDIHVVTEKATSVREGIFDLQGRRLNSEPTKGMYIKNGVKYVK